MKREPIVFSQNMVTLSNKSARLRFIECGPECIKKKDCIAKCCDAPTKPTGMVVSIDPTEEERIKKLGGKIKDGYLLPYPKDRFCPFKNEEHLCSLHDRGLKPFGCIVSPFMLNKTGKLIVRNRYKLLPCYDKKNGKPAYKVFKSSLVAIFGASTADSIEEYLDKGSTKDLTLPVTGPVYKMLAGREKKLKARK